METDDILILNCKQLRAELKKVGLPHGGKKAELQKRLNDHFQKDETKSPEKFNTNSQIQSD